MVLVLLKGTGTQKANVKNSIKGILYDFDTILWQKYKNRFFGVFSLWKWFLLLFKGTRT